MTEAGISVVVRRGIQDEQVPGRFMEILAPANG